MAQRGIVQNVDDIRPADRKEERKEAKSVWQMHDSKKSPYLHIIIMSLVLLFCNRVVLRKRLLPGASETMLFCAAYAWRSQYAWPPTS
jgi:hypothetical protein